VKIHTGKAECLNVEFEGQTFVQSWSIGIKLNLAGLKYFAICFMIIKLIIRDDSLLI
jgi:hypothetical protein